ncbi:MAG: hypothetical protein ACRCT8_10430 [Lacipirellulaceae bacterium]
MKRSRPEKPEPSSRSAVLGIGLDAHDGHKRLTHGRDFVLAGGSEETQPRCRRW